MERYQITIDKWDGDFTVEVHEFHTPLDNYFRVFTNIDDAEDYALTLRAQFAPATIVIL